MISESLCLSDVVLDAAKEVFETMIFMDIVSSEVQDPLKGDTYLGSITFKGDLDGCLGICCEIPCVRSIAAGMLGMDSGDSLSEQELVDAIGEVANMVMGSVKTRLQGTTPNIEVSIPAVVSGRILKANMGDGASRVLLKVKVGGVHEAEISFLCRAGA